jgi:hypothetical protein
MRFASHCRFRERTDCAFRKALCFDLEGMVKARTVIFPSYGGRKFHQLGVVQVHAKLGGVITALA